MEVVNLPLNENSDHRFPLSIYWLGVEGVQQVVRVAVAVSAHHHQGDEGGQEDGGQHPDGDDHHRLHGDSGSHAGCGEQQLVERWEEKKASPIRRRRVIVQSSIMDGCSSVEEGRQIAGVSLIGWHLRIFLQRNFHFFENTIHLPGGPMWRRILSAVFCQFLNMAHLQRTHETDLYLKCTCAFCLQQNTRDFISRYGANCNRRHTILYEFYPQS